MKNKFFSKMKSTWIGRLCILFVLCLVCAIAPLWGASETKVAKADTIEVSEVYKDTTYSNVVFVRPNASVYTTLQNSCTSHNVNDYVYINDMSIAEYNAANPSAPCTIVPWAHDFQLQFTDAAEVKKVERVVIKAGFSFTYSGTARTTETDTYFVFYENKTSGLENAAKANGITVKEVFRGVSNPTNTIFLRPDSAVHTTLQNVTAHNVADKVLLNGKTIAEWNAENPTANCKIVPWAWDFQLQFANKEEASKVERVTILSGMHFRSGTTSYVTTADTHYIFRNNVSGDDKATVMQPLEKIQQIYRSGNLLMVQPDTVRFTTFRENSPSHQYLMEKHVLLDGVSIADYNAANPDSVITEQGWNYDIQLQMTTEKCQSVQEITLEENFAFTYGSVWYYLTKDQTFRYAGGTYWKDITNITTLDDKIALSYNQNGKDAFYLTMGIGATGAGLNSLCNYTSPAFLVNNVYLDGKAIAEWNATESDRIQLVGWGDDFQILFKNTADRNLIKTVEIKAAGFIFTYSNTTYGLKNDVTFTVYNNRIVKGETVDAEALEVSVDEEAVEVNTNYTVVYYTLNPEVLNKDWRFNIMTVNSPLTSIQEYLTINGKTVGEINRTTDDSAYDYTALKLYLGSDLARYMQPACLEIVPLGDEDIVLKMIVQKEYINTLGGEFIVGVKAGLCFHDGTTAYELKEDVVVELAQHVCTFVNGELSCSCGATTSKVEIMRVKPQFLSNGTQYQIHLITNIPSSVTLPNYHDNGNLNPWRALKNIVGKDLDTGAYFQGVDGYWAYSITRTIAKLPENASSTDGTKYYFDFIVNKGLKVGDNFSIAADTSIRITYDSSLANNVAVTAELLSWVSPWQFATQAGASIRMNEPTGLGFTSEIPMAQWDSIISNASSVEYGTLIIPTAKLTGELTLDTTDVVKVVAEGWIEKDGKYTYRGSIVEIPEAEYTTSLTGRGYMIVAYSDGTRTLWYGEPQTRTVKEVAQKAAMDVKSSQTATHPNLVTEGAFAGGYSPYRSDYYTVLLKFAGEIEMPAQVDLVTDSVAKYTIVKANNATETQNTAANTLKTYLDTATGANFAIKTIAEVENLFTGNYILVGNVDNMVTGLESVGADGYRYGFVRGLANLIYISGTTDRGTLYGVYGFLEDTFDYVFTGTGDYSYTAATTKTLVTADFGGGVDNASVTSRTYLNWSTSDWHATSTRVVQLRNNTSYNDVKVIDNVAGISGPGALDNYGGVGLPIAAYDNITHNSFDTLTEGVALYNALNGTSFTTNDFKATNGDEVCWNKTKDGVSSQTIIFYALRRLILENYADGIRYYSFFQEDISNGCECGSCYVEKGGYSAGLVAFLNGIIEKLNADTQVIALGAADSFKLVTFAYSYTAQAPEDDTRADNQLVIRIAVNPSSAQYSLFDKTHNSEQATLIEEWNARCDEMMFYLYDTSFSFYLDYYPTTNRSIADNVKGMIDCGATFVTVLGVHNAQSGYAWGSNMRAYIYSKMLYNFDQAKYEADAEGYVTELRDEFLKAYYKNSWETVATIIDGYQDAYETNGYKVVNNTSYAYQNFSHNIAETTHLGYVNTLDDAIASAENDTIAKRLKEVQLSCYVGAHCTAATGPYTRTAYQTKIEELCSELGLKFWAETQSVDNYFTIG